MAEPIEDPLASIETAIVLSSYDWGEHHRLAWIYGIAVGWDIASLQELQIRFRWTDETVQRLCRLRANYVALKCTERE